MSFDLQSKYITLVQTLLLLLLFFFLHLGWTAKLKAVGRWFKNFDNIEMNVKC